MGGQTCCKKESKTMEAFIDRAAMQASLGLRSTLAVQMLGGDLYIRDHTSES